MTDGGKNWQKILDRKKVGVSLQRENRKTKF